MADQAYDSLKSYFNDYFSRKPEDSAPSADELLQEEAVPNKTAHLETPQPKASSPMALNEDESFDLPF